MIVQDEVRSALLNTFWFRHPGAYVLVDGQFGSTGKGLMASVMAEACAGYIEEVTTNAGPNSGHTAYSPQDGSKIVTRQLPVASVVSAALGHQIHTYLNSGAIINPHILRSEMKAFDVYNVSVNPFAAIIEPQDELAEASGSVARIASTGKGVGSALSRKIMRDTNVARNCRELETLLSPWTYLTSDIDKTIFVETAQGFSLGINSGFYPHTTSRECTVAQALSDARISPFMLRKVVACYRTYPIRVGNTQLGHSGNGYYDQKEVSWEEIGVEPEFTTVTGRMRRIFTWSHIQFQESVRVNQPDTLFLNFMQYLPDHERILFVDGVIDQYKRVLGRYPELVLLGWGPFNNDVTVHHQQ